MKIMQASLMIIAASILPVTTALAKNLAGFVIVSVGEVRALDLETQQERPLKRRSKVFEGDEVRTGEGAKVQLKFKDKGVIALQENTALQISEFEYTGQAGGEEKSFFRLVKGGFRAISGAIGKQDPEDYRVDTPLATIGIRGTDYGLKLGRVMGVKVNSGAVSVRNQAGEILIGDGHDFRHALVSSATELPRGSLNPVRVLRNSLPATVTEPADEEDIPDVDDAKVIKTQQRAPRELTLRMHSQEKELSDEMAQEEAEDKEEEENEKPRTKSGSVEDTASKMEQVFSTQLESDSVISVEEDTSISWETMEEVVKELDDGGSHSDSDIENAIADVSDGNTKVTVGSDSGTADSGTNNTGTTDPVVTDPGVTDTGTTDPGTVLGDARISDTELADMAGHWGIAAINRQPDPNDLDASLSGGWARDESTGLPGVFTDRGAPPDDPNYSTLALIDVLRQETHTTDKTGFARWDTSISTAVSAFSWGRWSGGEARLYTDANDASIYTPITEDIYWFTGSPADMTTVPTSGQARFEHVFLLAGNGSAGPVIEEDATSIDIRFTIDWLNKTFTDGEMRLVNGVQGDPAQQTQWKFFDMAGNIQNVDGNPSPILNFTAMTGEVCVAQCSIPMSASGEIQAFLMEGNHQIGGHFLFWETGNPAEWVNGVFAVGEEQRYSPAEAQNLNRAFFGVYHESPFDTAGVTTSALMRGKSETPTTGDFLMVDTLEPAYGAVIRLGSGVVESNNPGGSTALHGHTVDWGAWNGSTIDTAFTSSPAFATEKYSWISYSPVEAATMDTLTDELSFSLPYVFYGWQRDPGTNSDVPLDFERGYINVDLLNDTLDGAFVFYGTGRFDVSFSGSTLGDGITVESSSAFFNGTPVNISMDGQYIGATFADGIAGGFSVGDPGNLNIFATGVYAFGRDERIAATEISGFTQAAFMSFDAADTAGAKVYSGLATTPTSGVFRYRDADPVNGNLLSPATTSPMFNTATLGSATVDWGAWDDPAGSVQVQDSPLDATSTATLTDAVAWVVGTPSDLADIPKAGLSTYGTVVGFVGYENGLPLSTPSSMSMAVDFAAQSFTANLSVDASTNTWDMTYNGSLSGNRLSGSGTGTWTSGGIGSAATGVIEGALVGTGATTSPGAGPEGIIGTFKNQVTGDPSTHSSGAFVLQQ